jgi:type I restriction enzyme S subunit
LELNPGYKQTDVGVIPEDWEVRRIGSVCKLINGRGFKPFEWKRTGLPIIRIQNLNGSDDFNFYTGAYDKKLEVEPGQLLFAWSGSRGTSFGPHIWQGPLGLLNYHTWKLQIQGSEISKTFFLHALRQLTAFIEGEAHGASALVHTQKWEMEGFQFPLPPTQAEQQAIAKALSDADALIESVEQLIAKKRNLKQGAMQELVTGKKRLPGFQPARQETEIGKLPTDWDVVDVGEVTLRHKQGFYTKDRYVDSGTRLVRITDLMGNAVDFSSMPMLKMSQPEFEHFQICGGDFLFARSGAIGRYGIIHDQIDAVFGSYIIRFVFDRHKISNEYFGYLYQTSLVSKQLLSITQGSSNININAENIKALRIPLPTANEQDAIATILLQMDAEIAALEAKLDKARQLKQGMMHNLLTGKIRLV